MKKIFRRILVWGGLLLALLAALVLLVPRVVPGDAFTEQVVREVERATGAKVTLEEARIQWRGTWRVTMRDGSVAGTGASLASATGTPNDLESYAVDIRELSIEPALWPLLKKQLKVKAVRVSGPRLIVRGAQGVTEATAFKLLVKDLNLRLDQATSRVPSGDLEFSFTASADTLVLQKAPYTLLDLKGRFSDRVLKVTEVSARRSTGSLEGNLAVDFGADPRGHLVFEAEAKEVPATVLLEPWVAGFDNRLECDLNLEVTGDCDLGDKATIVRSLNLEGWMEGGEGILHAQDWLQDVTPYLGQRQDLKDIRFTHLNNQFLFSEGRYYFHHLALVGGDTEWLGKGWLDLAGNMAMGIDVKLPPGFTPDLGNFSFLAHTLRDDEGRINLPLKLSGRTNRPTVGVDLGRAPLD